MNDESLPPSDEGQCRLPLRVRVEVKNEVLGNSVFWEGPTNQVHTIRNIPARMTAELVAKDGIARVCGMWHVSAA